MVQTPLSFYLDYAQEVCVEINAALADYTDFGESCPQRLRDAMRYSLLAPGKRLRPLLVLMAAEVCGGDRRAAMPAACAVEMVHTYSLIHDDLPAMDDDDMRRGQASCHAAFGDAMAILAGDALLARAFEVLSSEIEPPRLAAACCQTLAHAAGATALVGGQVDDLAAEFSDQGLVELDTIHRRKTGAMFRASLRLGALVADADAEPLAGLDAYGQKLGLAFQVVDDLLDLKGDEAALGKRTGKDTTRGKLTFPAAMGVEVSQRRAEQLVQEACQALRPFGPRASVLKSLAWYVLERNR
jgi:geranylgeranyl diphosphate synthase type II